LNNEYKNIDIIFNSSNDYSILETIGTGGFGTVYKVEATIEPEYFAVKKIPINGILINYFKLKHIF